jgi:hypothetical protein
LHHAKGEQDRGVSTLALPRTIALMKNPWNQFSLDAQLARKVTQRIDPLLTDPAGVPNGKSKRRQLSRDEATKLTKSLIEAVGHASVFAANGPLPNRVRGLGRPPDNSVLIFIDDIIRACEVAGLKPGLRYVKPESLPVRIYKVGRGEACSTVGGRRPRTSRRAGGA